MTGLLDRLRIITKLQYSNKINNDVYMICYTDFYLGGRLVRE